MTIYLQDNFTGSGPVNGRVPDTVPGNFVWSAAVIGGVYSQEYDVAGGLVTCPSIQPGSMSYGAPFQTPWVSGAQPSFLAPEACRVTAQFYPNPSANINSSFAVLDLYFNVSGMTQILEVSLFGSGVWVSYMYQASGGTMQYAGVQINYGYASQPSLSAPVLVSLSFDGAQLSLTVNGVTTSIAFTLLNPTSLSNLAIALQPAASLDSITVASLVTTFVPWWHNYVGVSES